MSAEERLGDDAHRVLRSARWWARHLGGDEVDERHLLIGVVSVDDSELRFQLHGLRMTTHTVVEALGLTEEDDLEGGLPADDVEVPLSPDVEAVLHRALGESVKLDDDDIRPAHLLLALLEIGTVAVDSVLARLGVQRDHLAGEIRSLLGVPGRGTLRRVTRSTTGEGVEDALLGQDPPVRGWTTPRCVHCHKLLAEHAKVSTMLFEDDITAEPVPFRALWCSACGSTLHIERLGPDAGGRPVA